MTKRRLGELLQAEGLVTEEQVRQGLEEQRKNNLFLGEALVKLGYVSEEAIAQTIIQQFSLPFMSAQQYQISIEVLNLFPERMYFEYQFVAVDKIGKTLIIIGAGLMNHDVLDELERLSGCKVCQFVSTWKDIRATLDKHAKDLKKDQLSLSSLGSMLLDNDHAQSAPAPKLTTIPAAKSGSAPAITQRPTLSPVTKSVIIPAAAARTAAASGLNPAITGPLTAKAASGSGARPSAPAPGAPGAPSATTTPRLSALSGARPAITSAPNKPAPPAPGTPAPNEAPPSSESGRNPPQGGSKTGLLGLFKKQP